MAILTEEVFNIQIEDGQIIEVSVENVVVPSSSGDMLISVYDKNNNQAVDFSENLISIIEAQEDIPAFSPVSIDGYIPDSSNIAFRDRILGIALEDIATGYAGKVLTKGIVTNLSWNFTPYALIFLNLKSISQIPPSVGFIQELGKALNQNTMFVDVKKSIRL